MHTLSIRIYMWKVYSWKGENINDIEKWTSDRGEKMVDIVWKIKEVNPYARRPQDIITWREEKDTMPESFWNSLCYRGDQQQVKSTKLRRPKL